MLNDIDEAYASEQAIFIYPAGLVSRKNDAGEIVDLEWKKSFITKAKKHQRNIVPLYVSGKKFKSFLQPGSDGELNCGNKSKY